MDYAIAALIGLFITVGVYFLLSRSVIRMLLGVSVFGNAVNLLIFVGGRLTREVPPIVPPDLYQAEGAVANPLPQALVLTAIVIGFAVVLGCAGLSCLELFVAFLQAYVFVFLTTLFIGASVSPEH